MEAIIEIFKASGSLHHAYLIEGPREENIAALVEFLENDAKIATHGNPDFWQESYETMGIDEARDFSERQLRRAVGGGRKIFIAGADSITVEAQNSLLKVLEEPTEGTHFFFLMPTSERLLPTLRSRLEIVHGIAGGANGMGREADKFLSMNPAERAEFLKPLIDDKDKSGAIRFVSVLELAFRKKIDLVRASAEEIFSLEEIEKGRGYLLDRSPSVKMILEHVASVLPRLK